MMEILKTPEPKIIFQTGACLRLFTPEPVKKRRLFMKIRAFRDASEGFPLWGEFTFQASLWQGALPVAALNISLTEATRVRQRKSVFLDESTGTFLACHFDCICGKIKLMLAEIVRQSDLYLLDLIKRHLAVPAVASRQIAVEAALGRFTTTSYDPRYSRKLCSSGGEKSGVSCW